MHQFSLSPTSPERATGGTPALPSRGYLAEALVRISCGLPADWVCPRGWWGSKPALLLLPLKSDIFYFRFLEKTDTSCFLVDRGEEEGNQFLALFSTFFFFHNCIS